MILHIPHSSTVTLNYNINNKRRELLRMTDHFTDELYSSNDVTEVIFGLSRLVCDVERFSDDALESMSRVGMGVCYTTDTEGEELRVVTQKDKQDIIESYYEPHHKRLSDEVDLELKETGKSLIIDCHSFPNKAYYFNSDFNENRPDICIGTDSFHTPLILTQTIKKFFLQKGYDVRVDSPYCGTMVPMKHYKKDSRVSSIMLEVNRRLYMDEEGFKTEHFKRLQEELSEILNAVKWLSI